MTDGPRNCTSPTPRSSGLEMRISVWVDGFPTEPGFRRARSRRWSRGRSSRSSRSPRGCRRRTSPRSGERHRRERPRRRCGRSEAAGARLRSALLRIARCTWSARRTSPWWQSQPSWRAPARARTAASRIRRRPSRRTDDHLLTEDVREGRDAEEDVVPGERERVGAEAGRSTDAPVRQDRGLREAGRPGCEQQCGRVVVLAFGDLRQRLAIDRQRAIGD